MSVTKSRHDPWQLFGLSTDVKWTDSEMPVGSSFTETDTDKRYTWDGTDWKRTNNFLGYASTITIYNVSITAGATAYSQALPSYTKSMQVSLQTGASTATYRLGFATSAVTSGGTAIQKPANETWSSDNVEMTSTTVYIAASTAPQTAQIITWS